MQLILWAFGSMLILLFISVKLPIGFTIKSKIIIVIVSFLLSICGVFALKIFAVWQTVLIVIFLLFLTTYVMVNRLGEKLFLGKKIDTASQDYINSRFEEVLEDIHPLKNESYSPILLKDEPIVNNTYSEPNNNEQLEEDLSFLLNQEAKEQIINLVSEENSEKESLYLSEIENLLVTDGAMLEEEESNLELINFEKEISQNPSNQEITALH